MNFAHFLVLLSKSPLVALFVSSLIVLPPDQSGHRTEKQSGGDKVLVAICSASFLKTVILITCSVNVANSSLSDHTKTILQGSVVKYLFIFHSQKLNTNQQKKNFCNDKFRTNC